jgi:hypothetical protein
MSLNSSTEGAAGMSGTNEPANTRYDDQKAKGSQQEDELLQNIDTISNQNKPLLSDKDADPENGKSKDILL